ncbi:hypothetical protein Baya_9157 [Bagarius yarrelli]|uniref:Uncharacterized protein n=1 Tax=Bagarius yarrelli TaxID=175774 RepID=A0A556U6W1_BAGYA|nr:hypothetical protein Baya_9157 [Bagarius yarrelli]
MITRSLQGISKDKLEEHTTCVPQRNYFCLCTHPFHRPLSREFKCCRFCGMTPEIGQKMTVSVKHKFKPETIVVSNLALVELDLPLLQYYQMNLPV